MAQNTSTAVMQRRVEAADSLDLFRTPPWATRALIEMLDRLGAPALDGRCWEPACGPGDMSRVLADRFASVRASDVFDHGGGHEVQDFTDPDLRPAGEDWIVTNPPFRLAAEFVFQARRLAFAGVAVLVRSAFMEGGARFAGLFDPCPPTWQLQFVERVPMHKATLTRGASTATSYSWLVWLIGSVAAPRLKGLSWTQTIWIPPCRKRLERWGDYDDDADADPASGNLFGAADA